LNTDQDLANGPWSPIFYLILFKKTSIRLEHGIGLQALSHHNSLMLAGCFIKLIIHFSTKINKEKSSKKESVVIIVTSIKKYCKQI